MVFAHEVNRITFSGTMFSASEIWSTGFYLGDEDADTTMCTDASLTKLLAYWKTFFELSTSHISGDWKTLGVKAALYESNGHYPDENVIEKFYATPISGGEGGGSLPPQVSLSAQLATAIPHGLGAKGRMFLPGIRTPVSSTTGKIGATESGQIATALRAFFASVNGDADIPGLVINASKGSGLLPGLNARNVYVTTVRVGDVYDTQRRRRNALHETYASSTI
jgi:hypothetical protein